MLNSKNNKIMLRKIYIIVFLIIASATLAKADADSKGKDFWLSFMPNYHNNVENNDPAFKYGDSLYIFINAEQPTKGKITYRDRYGIETIKNFEIINPAQLYTFKVSYFDYEIWGYNYHGRYWSNFQTEKPAPQSFHVETDEPVTVYAHSQAITTSDAFLVLPVEAVGFEYYIMSYSSDGSENVGAYGRTPSQFLIVATEEQTTITINTTVATYLHPAGMRRIVLDKGYSYLVQATFDAGVKNPDLTGTHITADKPIVVFGGHQRSVIPITDNNASSRDCLIEQIPSVSTWGKNAFVIPPHETRDTIATKGSLFRILASQDSTEITINNNLVTTLDKGEFYEEVLTKPLEINANKPILVGIFKYTSGLKSSTSALGDPFMMLIPPKEQFIKKCKVINVQAWEKNSGDNNFYPVYLEQYITLVAPETALDSIYMDNIKIDKTDFTQILNSGYYYAHVEVIPGIHDIAAKEQIGVYIYGYGRANSYGYTGGMGLKVINYNPPHLVTIDSCFKTSGTVMTSDSNKRYLTDVHEETDSTENVTVKIDAFSNKYKSNFEVELINNRLDGMTIIYAEDNAGNSARKKIDIPGLTLAAAGHSASDSLPVYFFNAYPEDSLYVRIWNYGKFTKKILSVSLTSGSIGQIKNFPDEIKAGYTDSINVYFKLDDNKTLRDTLYITTQCGTVAIAALYITSSDCDPSAFEFPEFIDNTKLRFNGKAKLYHGAARLTTNEFYQIGSMWYLETVPVLDGFSTEFSFRFSQGNNGKCDDGSSPGADGIAFVIQNVGNAAIGYAGGSIGYEGIYNSLAIEFDTYSNDANQIENYFDPNGNHIAVQTLGTKKNTSKHTIQANLAMSENVMPMLADSTLYYARIVFSLKDKKLTVYLDTVPNPQKEVLVLTRFEIGKYLSLDRGYRAFVGFTAATGCAVENHDIVSWSFCPEFPNPETSIEDNTTDNINSKTINIKPNPFNSNCNISINLENDNNISLTIFDLMGNVVATLYNGMLTQGTHNFNWMPKARDRGLYFIKLNDGTKQIIEKIVFTY